ncbi:hypothetical protein Thermo_01413 [Thermoplasmatales archaeon]|nr:hypothetical protein Thermo_01413 [Thermoplasmatales archaeon]
MESDTEEDSGTGRNQLVGNIGLYYVCYELSKRGWNAMPTARNARGVDIVIYNQKGTVSHTLQVKSLTKRNPAPFGSNLGSLIAEYIFIVNNVYEMPNLYIVDTSTAKPRIHEGIKNGRKSYWFQPRDYDEFKDNWDIIGQGATNGQKL